MRQAADRAAEALAWDRAARLYERALGAERQPAARSALLEALGDALDGSGRGLDAARAYGSAAQLAPPESAERLISLRSRAAAQLLRTGHFDEGYAALAEVLSELGSSLAPTPQHALVSYLAKRARLRLRGFDFTPRPEGAGADPHTLAKLDAHFRAGVALSAADSLRGSDLMSGSLLMALEAGEPKRIARSLTYEACYRSNRGGESTTEAESLLERVRATAETYDDGYLRALATGATCIVRFHAGDWPGAARFGYRGETLFREQRVGLVREIETVRFHAGTADALAGRFDRLERRVPEWLRLADERRDVFSGANYRSGLINLRWLARDEPGRAGSAVERASGLWTRKGFHVQHFFELVARVQCALYRGEPGAAQRLLDAKAVELRLSLITRLLFTRVLIAELRARVALAAAPGRRRTRWAVRRAVRLMRSSGLGWARGLAALLEAQLHQRAGKRSEALASYRRAERELADASMEVHRMVCRRATSQLEGAPTEPIDEALRALGIARPSRYAALIAPLTVEGVRRAGSSSG